MTSIARLQNLIARVLLLPAFFVLAGCITNTVANAPSLTPAAQTQSASTDDSALNESAGTRVALLTSQTPLAESTALTAEMARMLSANGFRLVPPPQQVNPDDDLYFVAPEIEVKPGENGKNVIHVAWIVANSNGDPLGKIAQARQLPGSFDSDGWRNQSTLGAAAAAEGVSRIIREQQRL